MKFLRRLALILAELVLFLLVTVVLLYPSLLEQVIADLANIDIVVRAAIVVFVDLVLLAAIFVQLQPQHTYRGEGLVVKSGKSMATISTESVDNKIIKAVKEIGDIESVTCKTRSEGGHAAIDLDVVMSRDDIQVPAKQREIERAIKRVITKQMGLKMSRPPIVKIQMTSSEAQRPAIILTSESSGEVASIENGQRS